MPVRLIRSDSNSVLWAAFAESFLEATRGHPGPAGHAAFAWLTHRTQRDALLQEAARRGCPGWLAPPLAFFSELRRMFGIEARPVGILTGRMLVSRLAARHGSEHGLGMDGGRGPGGVHMLDGVLSELLPEGVEPGHLRRALGELVGDEFTERRNAWVADTYEAFLRELDRRGLYDPRSIHAMVARRIESGDLVRAIGGARTLHVYGLTSLRARRRLMTALASQEAVDVVVYLPVEERHSEWDDVATAGSERIGEPRDVRGRQSRIEVQPTPDAIREAAWVARRVKRLLVEGRAEPHEVAVVARSGHRDTRRVHAALDAAGVPSTARLRTVLAEVPVLKAVLGLLRAAADGWRYDGLRQVLASPYFAIGVDLRAVDYLASLRRLTGLKAWGNALTRLRRDLEGEDARRLRRRGLSSGRLDADLRRFQELCERVEVLEGPRSEGAWIQLTLGILSGDVFAVRRNLCQPVAGRYDLVRLDQRGVVQVESLLREWSGLVDDDRPIAADEWHGRLERLLSANDLALSTPLQEGVQVLEAHEAALTPFRFVFLVHANDGEFPRIGAPRGVFGDEERSRLRAKGLPLSDREERLGREHALWNAVTNGEEVIITYRTTDATGTPRLPSLLVPWHDAARELPRTLDLAAVSERHDADLAPVSPAQHARREVQRLAARRRAGDDGAFRTPEPELMRHAVLGAFAEALRAGDLDPVVRREADLAVRPAESGGPATPDPARLFGRDLPISQRPSAWNGKLRDPFLIEWLGRTFDESYVWSASQLETYGKRPFDFLLERVLRVEQVEEAEEETSPLEWGSVAHSVLEEFYRSVMDDLPSALDEAALRAFERAADRAVEAAESDAERWLGLPPVWAVRKAAVREDVRRFLEWDLPTMARAGETPVYLEYRFGGDGEPQVLLEGRDVRDRRATLLLRGRIDRIEHAGQGSGAVLRVVDYKSATGSLPRRTGYEDGAMLQLALYMKAIDALELGSVDLGRYRSIRERKNAYPLKWSQVEPVMRLAFSIPARVRQGLFEAVQAASADIASWQPQRDVTRTEASLAGGARFDPVSE